MSREVHVQFWERVGVKLPGATHLIITGADKTVLENEVKPLVEQFLRDRGLQLSQEKTCITNIAHGFDFLGQNLRKYGGKLLIQPSRKNTLACLDKVRQLIRRHRALNQLDLIRVLNPVLRGWANYHRHVVAKRTFCWMEIAVQNSLWFWAKRRHPEKPFPWIVGRYWHHLNGKKVFAADTGKRTPDGKIIWLRLVCPSRIPIRRHVKIKADANPFDPAWCRYFADREIIKRFGPRRR